MMLGEGNPSNPTVHVPPWPIFDDPTAGMLCPSPHPVSGVSVNNSNGGVGVGFEDYSLFFETVAALQRYLPSNDTDADELGSDSPGREVDSVMDVYSCDEFRMYEFKVRRCARGRSHDWTECPFAHPGEKARRRDPRKFHYSGTACPDFRKGNCKRGDACEYAHGVFECWLHPARYRTQPCKDGINCRRRVCFFAHTPEQLRVLANQTQSQAQSPKSAAGACSVVFDSYDGSPLRSSAYFSPPKSAMLSSPTSTLLSPPLSPPSDSPPHSPIGSALRRSVQSSSVNEVLASLRQLQLNKAKSIPPSWGMQFGSPKMAGVRPAPPLFRSLPSTPTTTANAGARWLDVWERDCVEEEPMERVESGRDLRAKIFEKLSKENLMEKDETEGAPLAATAPDVDWVSELVK